MSGSRTVFMTVPEEKRYGKKKKTKKKEKDRYPDPRRAGTTFCSIIIMHTSSATYAEAEALGQKTNSSHIAATLKFSPCSARSEKHFKYSTHTPKPRTNFSCHNPGFP